MTTDTISLLYIHSHPQGECCVCGCNPQRRMLIETLVLHYSVVVWGLQESWIYYFRKLHETTGIATVSLHTGKWKDLNRLNKCSSWSFSSIECLYLCKLNDTYLIRWYLCESYWFGPTGVDTQWRWTLMRFCVEFQSSAFLIITQQPSPLLPPSHFTGRVKGQPLVFLVSGLTPNTLNYPSSTLVQGTAEKVWCS